MLDINQALGSPQHYALDPEGHMVGLAQWSPQHANREAELEGIEMTDEHWRVIFYLRERYRERGNSDAARDVLHDLEARFCEKHGRSHLYELFPRGPVGQASRIAGLPLPPHTQDLSFGSMM